MYPSANLIRDGDLYRSPSLRCLGKANVTPVAEKTSPLKPSFDKKDRCSQSNVSAYSLVDDPSSDSPATIIEMIELSIWSCMSNLTDRASVVFCGITGEEPWHQGNYISALTNFPKR